MSLSVRSSISLSVSLSVCLILKVARACECVLCFLCHKLVYNISYVYEYVE